MNLASHSQQWFTKLTTRVVMHAAAPLAAQLTRHRVQAMGREQNHHPIFIVGPPRCGSTVLYQALTNYFNVLYIDNLAARWARALYAGMYFSIRRFDRLPHDCFTADYGDTSRDGGWHAPSECGAFWYRWIADDQHHVANADLTPEMVEGLRSEVHAVQNRWGGPLMFKNLHVGQRLAWTRKAFPDARYLCIHRNRDEVVASLLRARAGLNVPRGVLWSTRPAGWSFADGESETTMVDRQVRLITEKIENDLADLNPDLVRHVRYEDFSQDLAERAGEWLGLERRPGGSLPEFAVDERSTRGR